MLVAVVELVRAVPSLCAETRVSPHVCMLIRPPSRDVQVQGALRVEVDVQRAAAAGRPRLSLASEVIALPFDEFIERYLAEPGRRKTRQTVHGKAPE